MRIAHFLHRPVRSDAAEVVEHLLRYRSPAFADQTVVCMSGGPLAEVFARLGATVRITPDGREACRYLREADLVSLYADRLESLPAPLRGRFPKRRVMTATKTSRFPVRVADGCVALSDQIRRVQRIPAQWRVIREGIDLERYRVVQRRTIRRRVITRICRPYHQDEFCWYALLPVLAERPNVELWLLDGHGSSSERVRLLEPGTSLEDALSGSYLCIYTPHPRLKYDHGTRDRVLMTAMAMGVPCIVSDVPAVRETVRDSDAVISIPFNDVQALSEAVQALLNDAGAAAALARRARVLAMADLDAPPQVAE
jgi:hypothetical protein